MKAVVQSLRNTKNGRVLKRRSSIVSASSSPSSSSSSQAYSTSVVLSRELYDWKEDRHTFIDLTKKKPSVDGSSSSSSSKYTEVVEEYHHHFTEKIERCFDPLEVAVGMIKIWQSILYISSLQFFYSCSPLSPLTPCFPSPLLPFSSHTESSTDTESGPSYLIIRKDHPWNTHRIWNLGNSTESGPSSYSMPGPFWPLTLAESVVHPHRIWDRDRI